MRSRSIPWLGAAAAVALAAWWGRGLVPTEAPAPNEGSAMPAPPAASDVPGDDEAVTCDSRGDPPLRFPSGRPTALSCDQARRIVGQARQMLASPPAPVEAAAWGDATADWLDPHGLWSVAPDTPVAGAMRAAAPALLAEIEAAPGSGRCVTAEAVGTELGRWVAHVRKAFLEGRDDAAARALGTLGGEDAWKTLAGSPYESGPITRPATELARLLGRQATVAEHTFGAAIAPSVAALAQRVAPDLTEVGWAQVVLAAAVRAYVPHLDVHGAWAPADEEITLYDLALEVDPPERLWSEMTRTAMGVRVDKGALAPLAEGDIVISAHGVALAGVSVEQAEQLAVVSETGDPPVVVLRRGAPGPLTLTLAAPAAAHLPLPPAEPLPLTWATYADGRAAVVGIQDVPDDLGPRVADAVDAAKRGNAVGLVLDLRGNGGGSTDGAAEALGVFLPGVALFPMRRRDGGIETERAPNVPIQHQWTGPVAVLVDGDSASAAEMIAGAIRSYHRGVVLGARTYGKGCAQEYLDDDASVGVLRLTTLLYALPDGSPVQRTGIFPEIELSMTGGAETEGSMARALQPWRGPDVRDPARVRDVPWPAHGGKIGPCADDVVCRSLRALGAAKAAQR